MNSLNTEQHQPVVSHWDLSLVSPPPKKRDAKATQKLVEHYEFEIPDPKLFKSPHSWNDSRNPKT